MCVIAISPAGEKVSREVFERMWRSNSDGFGLLYRARDGVGIVKGLMDEQEAWEAYDGLPEGVPHVLHFRLATHGGVRPELTHPFLVHEESPLVQAGVVCEPVLAHNGIWSLHASKEREVRLGGPVSDTRVLAAWLGKLSKERPLREVLERHHYEVASAGRVVVVDPTTWRLHLVGSWIREGSLLFSNHSFRESLYSYAFPGVTCDWRWAEWPAGTAKKKKKKSTGSIDLEAIARPEAVPAEVDEVEAEGPAFARPYTATPTVKADPSLAILKRSLWVVAADLGRNAIEAVRHIELDDYGDVLIASGIVGMLEVEDEGRLWRVRLWDGTRSEEARSRFLVINSVMTEFVKREAAVLRFLDEVGIPPENAGIASYDDVFGYGVNEEGVFINERGDELTPEEAAEWLLRELWDEARKGA